MLKSLQQVKLEVFNGSTGSHLVVHEAEGQLYRSIVEDVSIVRGQLRTVGEVNVGDEDAARLPGGTGTGGEVVGSVPASDDAGLLLFPSAPHVSREEGNSCLAQVSLCHAD
jgi:hypothetical protein